MINNRVSQEIFDIVAFSYLGSVKFKEVIIIIKRIKKV